MADKYYPQGETLSLDGLKNWVNQYSAHYGEKNPCILVSVNKKTAFLTHSVWVDGNDGCIWLMDKPSFEDYTKTHKEVKNDKE